jgi:hypothetical protein
LRKSGSTNCADSAVRLPYLNIAVRASTYMLAQQGLAGRVEDTIVKFGYGN